MKLKLLITIVLMNFIYASNNAEIDLNIDDNVLEFDLGINLNSQYDMSEEGDYILSFNYLSRKEDDKRDGLGFVGLKVVSPFENSYNIKLGLGIKAVVSTSNEHTFVSLPLRILLNYDMSEIFSISFDGSYAPQILNFQDAIKYNDYSLRANMRVLQNGFIYLGSRAVRLTYNKFDKDFDTPIFFGYKIIF